LISFLKLSISMFFSFLDVITSSPFSFVMHGHFSTDG
jgi:hypothetical protein